MDVAIVGAGIAGLSAAWWMRRAGHHVQVFEKKYKAGGRMNSRRKAGLVVDHGEGFIRRDSPVLRELILDCGLHSELATIELPIFTLNPDGSFIENPEEAIDSGRVTFSAGMLMLPEALRRQTGGFYSIGIESIRWLEETRCFQLQAEPPLRASEMRFDAVIVATPAPEALRICESLRERLDRRFLEKAAQVRYTRGLTLMAALEEVKLDPPFYGLDASKVPDNMVNWLAFENLKCPQRHVPGWSSIVAQTSAQAVERIWEYADDKILQQLYAEVRRLVPNLPDEYRWARLKRWDVALLQSEEMALPVEDFPGADNNTLIEFCGDYRIGNGVEVAAQSGRQAAQALLARAGEQG